MEDDEIENLKIKKIKRNIKEGNEIAYIEMEGKGSANYLFRKAAIAKNDNVNIILFIPPMCYQRYAYLQKNCYLARKTNSGLKTQVRLGEEDFILLVKIREESSWRQELDLQELGSVFD